MIDLHIHTERCGHAVGSASDYLQAARELGLETIAFTDHLPLPEGFDDGYAMRADELSDYLDEVREVAGASAALGGPEVLLGIEVDWLPNHPGHASSLLEGVPFDVVLGSVHFIDGWAFDDPALIGEWANRDIDEVWGAYVEQCICAAASGLFDVMAHPDLPKKFGHIPSDLISAGLYDRLARGYAAAGVAIEVNTAGLRKPVGEIYPSPVLLRAFHRAGVPATMGSDAHAPAEIGSGFEQARVLLHSAGYTSLVVVRHRRFEEVPL